MVGGGSTARCIAAGVNINKGGGDAVTLFLLLLLYRLLTAGIPSLALRTFRIVVLILFSRLLHK